MFVLIQTLLTIYTQSVLFPLSLIGAFSLFVLAFILYQIEYHPYHGETYPAPRTAYAPQSGLPLDTYWVRGCTDGEYRACRDYPHALRSEPEVRAFIQQVITSSLHANQFTPEEYRQTVAGLDAYCNGFVYTYLQQVQAFDQRERELL